MKDNTKETNISYTTDELKNAVKIVQAAIKAKEDEYRKIASTEEQDPVLLEGMTTTGHMCHVMVDPKDVAQVFLDYNYATWNVLEDDPPVGLWEELSRMYGLDNVCGVDM